MPVCDEHSVHALEFLVRFRTERVGQNPRIHQNDLAAGSVNAKCRVAQPGDFIAACMKHGCVPPVDMNMNCRKLCRLLPAAVAALACATAARRTQRPAKSFLKI